MKTNYFVLEFNFNEEGEEFSCIHDVVDDREYADAIAKKLDRPDESIYFRVVECKEGYFHLTKLVTKDYLTDEEPIFEDYEFDCEEDACDALREDVETTNYYALDESYLDRDGEVNHDYIEMGLYSDNNDNLIMYMVVG